jgi:sterol desaturase/sphingolipid hydroxylase (fatty acid hydroxylase superfamily)
MRRHHLNGAARRVREHNMEPGTPVTGSSEAWMSGAASGWANASLSASAGESAVLVGNGVVLVVIAAAVVSGALRGRPPVWSEVAQNVISSVMNQIVVSLGTAALGLAGLTLVFDRAGFGSWGFSLVSWGIGFVLVDFAYYWNHRLEHRVSLLWGHHSVHHSSPAYDLTTSLRVAWHDGITVAFVYGPLAALGMEPAMIAVLIGVNLLLQVWIHTQAIGRVPGLEGIVNTPSAHRVHHASTPRALDCNYGGFLMIWDRLFGTYRREEEVCAVDGPLRYGLTTGAVGTNPLRVTTAHYLEIARLWRRCSTLPARVLAVLGPPEWTPEAGFAATAPRSWWRVLAGARAPGAP